ncbi:MAG TPA: TolC family outer membrane protein [Sphingomonadaceae bacterium]|nr:TolC family outer membrane protein [Sphingomonadaceae bacterium]
MAVRGRWIGAALAALLVGQAARADTLREAFIRVYTTNPSMTGARAGLRAIDENVPIARASGLPSVDATGSYNEFVKRSALNFTSPARSVGGELSVNVPIYQGGQVRNSVKAAETRVVAGRADLRSTEADLFTQTVAAYMDVIRDQSIVELNAGNVKVLETDLQASRDRFEVGDLTRTDVAQSDARLAGARSQLQSAEAQLDASRQTYLRIVGKFPENLEPPPPLPALPANADDAVDVATENNPALESARQASKAADYDIRSAEGQRLPQLSAFGTGDYVNYLNSLDDAGLGVGTLSQSQTTATVGLQARLPIFQGGLPGALVRQAQARKSQALEQVTLTERGVVAEARTAYSRYQAALGVIESSERAVSANELALEGVRAENSVGTRTVLDVLNAEQELLNTRVTLVAARRDAYVAGFALLAAIGKAEARDLGLDGGALYDPTANYRRVRHNLNDWSTDPAPQPIATRTVDVAAPSVVNTKPVTSVGN